LQPSDIAWGGLEALKCQFTLVGRCALAFDAALLLGGLATRRWKAPALFVYGVASGLLLWWGWAQTRGWRHSLLAMWAGLNSGRPAFSVWRTFGGSTWVWVMNLYNLRHAFSRFPTFPTGSIFEVGLAAAALLVAILAWFAHRSMARRGSTAPDQIERRLITEFREIAREPLPDRDNPGFKRWNVRERFPWGWDVVQEQLHERLARSRQG